MIDALYLLLALVAGHYLADFALQNDFVATQKQHAGQTAMGAHALVAHCWHHAAVAALIAYLFGYDPLIAGVVIGGTHLTIDLGKIRGLYSINIDQIQHISVCIATAALLVTTS